MLDPDLCNSEEKRRRPERWVFFVFCGFFFFFFNKLIRPISGPDLFPRFCIPLRENTGPLIAYNCGK